MDYAVSFLDKIVASFSLLPFVFFSKHTVIYLIIQIKYANCISKSSRETPCSSGTANKKHSSLHVVFWAAAALTDANGLLCKSTYYRSNGIFSSTIYLLFVSHFLSKITKGSLEISGDLPKPIYFLLTSCSNLCGQLLKEGPEKSPGFFLFFIQPSQRLAHWKKEENIQQYTVHYTCLSKLDSVQ